MKTPDQYFIDWEADTFGYGYGTGEEHTLGALKAFMAAIPQADPMVYDYQVLEKAVAPAVAWLLINILISDNKIDYGSSPRYGWLSEAGKSLALYIADKSVQQLYDIIVGDRRNGYIPCCPEFCNCSDGDCRLVNPFWKNPYLRVT